MKNILGEHYKGYKTVSAQAAFYGLSQALIPGTDFDKKKQKFLKDFKAEELLYQSHFKPLAEFIAEELLKNLRAKIIESNCNKALKVVEQLQKVIEITIEKWIDPMIKARQEYKEEVDDNLDRFTDKLYQIWKIQRSAKSINSNLILEKKCMNALKEVLEIMNVKKFLTMNSNKERQN